MAIALLVARIIAGLGIAAHGSQKLFGWFGGHGIKGTGDFFEQQLGFRPGNLFALGAGLGEFVGGVLTLLGFGGPIGPALIVLVMLVAILTVHLGHGFFVTKNGAELPLMYIVAAILIALSGPGLYSLDTVLGFQGLWQESIAWIAIAAATLVAFSNVGVRRRPQPQQESRAA